MHQLFTCTSLAMFTCTSCLLATTNLYHSSQFFCVHYTPVPPFPHLCPLPIRSFTNSHNPLETFFKLAFSYETSNDLVSLPLVNYQVLSEALQGYAWTTPFLADLSLHCLPYLQLSRVYASLCLIYYFPSLLPLSFKLKVIKQISLKAKHLAVTLGAWISFPCEASSCCSHIYS